MLSVLMKIFLPFLVFAFILSSFSAVAEAYCKDDCVHTEASSQSLDCADHQKPADGEKGSNDKTSKSVCMDCYHCCSSHGVGLQSFGTHLVSVPASLVPLSPDAIDLSGYLFSLLRPPKSLI